MTRPGLTVTATALGLVVAIAPLACGGDDAASPADAVRAYNTAVADGDGERACDLLDDSAQRELRDSTQGQARGSCKQIIELAAAFNDDATKERLRDAKVAGSEQGDRGSARFTSPAGFGGPDQAQTYELRKVDGEWKITSLGLSLDGSGTGAP